MDVSEAIKHAYKLHREWVSDREIREGKGYDLDRIHASMLQDYRYRRGKPQFAAVCQEIWGQFTLLGKIRKALA